MSEYPEHDKQHAIVEQSQAIGEFLEWVESEGWHIERRVEKVSDEPCTGRGNGHCENGEETVMHLRSGTYRWTGAKCRACKGTGRVQVEYTAVEHLNIIQALAEFFEIDLAKIEEEKRAMLAAIRATQGRLSDLRVQS